MKNTKKVIGSIGIGAVVVGAAFLGGCNTQPVEVPSAEDVANAVIAKLPEQEPNTINLDAEQVANAIVDKLPEQIEVPGEEVIVDASKEDLELILQEIYDNNGNISYLTNDLDDDELDKIVDRIVFSNDIKEYAVRAVYDDGIDELDEEMVANSSIKLDEDDIERFKVNDDEISLEDVSYDDKDAYVNVKTKFRQKDIWFDATFKVTIRDGAVDDIKLEEVKERA